MEALESITWSWLTKNISSEVTLVTACILVSGLQVVRLLWKNKQQDGVQEFETFDQKAYRNQDAEFSKNKTKETIKQQNIHQKTPTATKAKQTSDAQPRSIPSANSADIKDEVQHTGSAKVLDGNSNHAIDDEPKAKQDVRPVVLFVKPVGERPFSGYALLKALAENDVHFSEQKHFQRYAKANGQGEVWFYVASMEQPGTFDMTEPGKIECQGLVLILDVQRVKQVIHAFEALIESAHQLANDLRAQVFDQNMQKLTGARITELRHDVASQAAGAFV